LGPLAHERRGQAAAQHVLRLTMQTPDAAQVQFRPRRPRPQVVSLTEAAAERGREIMAKKTDQPYVGRRVGVKNGGCAGQEYTLEYALEAEPLDEVVED